MKKLFALLLCVTLLMLSAACTFTTSTDPSGDSTGDPSKPTDPPPSTYDAPMTSVSVPLHSESTKANDGKDIFTYTSQEISLILSDPNVADKVARDFLARMDIHNAAAQSVLNAAKNSYNGQTNWTPYFYSKTFHPTRLDQNVLSFVGEESIYNGSPRPTSTHISVTYDLTTGKALELIDILTPDYSADAIINLIVSALAGYASNGLLFIDYEHTIADMFSTNTPTTSWYLSKDGLCFFFNPYEIAPYSTGTITAQIPYNKLMGLIKDQYFPAEQPALYGTAQLTPMSSADLTMFTEFSELPLDERSTAYIIYTDGTLFDVSIESGTWSADGQTFQRSATVFAAASLCTSDGIIVHATQETLASLRLVCNSGGNQTYYKFSDLLK